MKQFNNTLFDKYLDGEMTSEEVASFEKTLSSEEDLNTEYQEYTQVRNALKFAKRRNIKNQIEEIYEANNETNKTPVIRMLTYGGIAASILLLAVFFFSRQGPDLSQLAKENYSPYPDKITVMGDNDSAIHKALVHYNNGDYTEAIMEFKSIKSDEAQFYMGVSYLAIDSTIAAYNQLQKFTRIKESSFYEPSLWYTALSLIGQDRSDEAIKHLQTITNDSELYFKKPEAKELLKNIE